MDNLVFEDRIDGRNLDAGTAKAYAILINKINELIDEIERIAKFQKDHDTSAGTIIDSYTIPIEPKPKKKK